MRVPVDKILLLLSSLAVIIGLLMFFSVSTAASTQRDQEALFFFYKQIYSGVIPGIILAFIVSRIDYKFWEKISLILVLIGFGLLIILDFTSVGLNLNGAVRWIDLGFFVFQPSEFVKLAAICYTAVWLNKRSGDLKSFVRGVLPLLLILLGFSVLLIRQPDAGTMIAMLATCGAMIFVGGVPFRHLLYILVASVAALLAIFRTSSYRWNRIVTYLNHNVDTQGTSYHVNQALITIGLGGTRGVGYGLSRQKSGYLPEILNDSVFAVISEELGFYRVSGIILILLAFCARIIYLSYTIKDGFGRLLVYGIGVNFAVHIFINIAAMVKLVPLTGLPLPFFSQGGSSYLVNMIMLGIVFSASRHRE